LADLQNNPMPDFQFVDLSGDNKLLAAIAGPDWIGLDTEFVREKTFYSRLCLIQISTGNEIFCADPLLLRSPEEDGPQQFWEMLMNKPWVLHSGRQDIEVLYQSANRMPTKIFDTQVAAALLGYQPQIGYANLVAELFDVELAKSHTRADWSRRPLPDSFIEYAAEDVLYLLPAQELLSERLDKLQRLEWAVEDSADLLQESLYINDPLQAINRLKGAGKLRGAARTAAVDLASWRENEALRSNRPRQWIMRDPVLVDLASSAAGNTDDLQKVAGLGARTIERAGQQLLQILANAAMNESDYLPPPRPDEGQKALLNKMQRRVSACAGDLGIATEILAPKKELSAAMLGARDSRIFRGWRRDLIGDDLLELLDGA
jgi:ribonuclease D